MRWVSFIVQDSSRISQYHKIACFTSEGILILVSSQTIGTYSHAKLGLAIIVILN